MKTLFIFAGASLLFATSAAQGQVVVTKEAEPFAIVNFADLNIHSASGQARLESRVRAAARGLCLESVKADLETTMPRVACYKSALNNGLSQINSAIAGRLSGSGAATASLVIRP